ncbi:MAG: chlorite dismutase family protein, partial [Ktedonobacterales bacterium]|nr:chlorite dismutase family protein [Ktedonobacterales bacterium]
VYSMVGLREDADLMIWVLGPDLEAIQRLAIALRQSGLGRSLTQVQTYIGVTTPARYDPEHQPAFLSGVAPKRYVSLYPFVKTAEWYLLPYERRRELMGEHGSVGRRYAVPRAKLVAESATSPRAPKNGTAAAVKPTTEAVAVEEEGGGILASTVDAFGLGDYEFILANEADDPAEISAMMMALRATEVRRYTKLDTPIFLARLRPPAEALADL